MIEFTEGQRRTVATGLTVLSLTLVVAFVAVTTWAVLKMLAFAAPAIIPVVLGFFLALFFKPYFLWWKRWLRNPTLALIVMLLTVFVPLGFLLWYAGAVMVDQVTNLVTQAPTLVGKVADWFQATFPKFHALLMQLGASTENVGDLYTKYGATALKAGTSALKCLTGILSSLVTLIFSVFFLLTTDRRG